MGIYSKHSIYYPITIMPGHDQTGPNGQGPMTGMGNGKCKRNKQSRNMCCRGLMRCRRWFGSPQCNMSLEETEKVLEEQLEAVRKERESSRE